MTLNINIETKNVIKILALATGFAVSVFAIAKMYDALILILIAFFLALALNPPVSFLSKYMPGKRRGPAIAIVFISVFALFGFLLASIIPPVVRETGSFVDTLPQTVNTAFYKNERIQGYINRYQLQDEVNDAVQTGKHKAQEFGQSAISDVGVIGSSFLTSFTVLVIAVLMLGSGGKVIARLSDALYRDPELRKRHERIGQRMYGAVTGYVLGQVSVASVAALFALGALLLLRIPYPLPLAAIVFTLGMIPLIGNTIAAILVVLSAVVLKDFTSGLILLAYFILYQQIENITLQPVVQGKTTNLPSLVIFVSVILGVALIGPIGGLFAIPVVGCLKVLLQDYLHHRDDVKPTSSSKSLVEKVKKRVSQTVSS